MMDSTGVRCRKSLREPEELEWLRLIQTGSWRPMDMKLQAFLPQILPTACPAAALDAKDSLPLTNMCNHSDTAAGASSSLVQME